MRMNSLSAAGAVWGRGRIVNRVRIPNSSRCCMFLLPSSGSERVRHSLATDFRVGKASQTERVRRPAVAIELCSSISRLGNSSKLGCARLDEMVGNLRLRVTGESRKRLLGSNRIEREASPANVRGGTKRLSTIRYSGSEFRGRIFRFGISGPRGERTETYLPTRLSGERRRD